jgi:sulfate adenylyltransferase subunit 1 (EFTu-like GTPase family)
VRDDFKLFAAPLNIPDLSFIPMSALRGDMIVERGSRLAWYRGPSLLNALEMIDVADDLAALPLRLPVQYVGRAASRRYMGRVASGAVRPGDEVVVLPSGQRTRISTVSLANDVRPRAAAGDSVAVVLEGELDISRGDMLVGSTRLPRVTRAFEANLCWLGTEPLRPDGRYLIKHASRTLKAKITAVEYWIDIHSLAKVPLTGEVRMNDIVRAALAVQQPVFVDCYVSNRVTGAFILIDEAANQTVAAGMIA